MHLVILGYVGPETVLPVASVLAAIAGAVMMFWRWIWRSLVNTMRLLRRRK